MTITFHPFIGQPRVVVGKEYRRLKWMGKRGTFCVFPTPHGRYVMEAK